MGWDLRVVSRQVCHCILERADFTEANAHDISGLTVTIRRNGGGMMGGIIPQNPLVGWVICWG